MLLTLSLLAGITTTLWQARRANQRFNDVRQLAHTFIFDIHDAVEKLPGSTSARQLLVTNALTYLDRLASEAENDVSLQRELASSYEKLADVLGAPDTRESRRSDGRDCDLPEGAGGARAGCWPPTPATRMSVAISDHVVEAGTCADQRGRPARRPRRGAQGVTDRGGAGGVRGHARRTASAGGQLYRRRLSARLEQSDP